MPMYKNYGRKKFRKGRKSNNQVAWYNRKYSPLDLAKSAWKTAKYVKSLINVERKFCDFPITTAQPTISLPYLTTLNYIAQGTNYNERDGISIKATSIQMRGKMYIDPVALMTNVRVILYMDNEPQGPSGANIVLETGGILDPINHNYGSRFQILCDKTFSLSTNGDETKQMSVFRKLNCHLKYTGTSPNAYTACTLNCLILSDRVGNPPTFDGYVRIRFIDN